MCECAEYNDGSAYLCPVCADIVRRDRDRLTAVEAIARETYEIYANSEDCVTETAPEAYFRQLVIDMAKSVARALPAKEQMGE